MDVPEGLNATNSPTTDSDTESLELAQVYGSSGTNRGPVAVMQRPHRPVFDRSANGTVVSPVECNSNQPVRVPALVPNIRVSNFSVGLPNPTAIAKPTVTDTGFIREDREPRDLKQALQYSLSLCDGKTPISEVTSERKAILNDVMDKCFRNTSVLRQRLQYLSNDDVYKSESELETVIECLESIEMEVELTDQANDFCKQNGMEILSRYFFSDMIEIRVVALNILATVVQNNPVGMQEAIRQGMFQLLLEDLMRIAESVGPKSENLEFSKTLSDAVAGKSLYAMSCLLRGNPAGCELFKTSFGFNYTLRILAFHPNSKVLKKCYYIILSLIADEIEKGGSVDVSHIENDDWRHYLSSIIERFSRMGDSLPVAATLAQVLEEIISRYHGHSEHLQILSLLKEKGAPLAVETYLNNTDDSATMDLSLALDEVEIVKTCQALKKFIEGTD